MFVLYKTNSSFNKELFAKRLREHGVTAKATEHGVILDRDAFNAIPQYVLPHWLWVNKAIINSEYHTEKVEL